MAERFSTDTFANIPLDKQERILRAAADIFGRDGVSGARMAEIAKSAGISHGSLFSYFPTKDHLVRAIIAHGVEMERERLQVPPGAPLSETLASVLGSAWATAEGESGLISLWLSLSLRENARFEGDILPMEADASSRWLDIVSRAGDAGEVPSGVDPRIVAFVLDAVVAQLMKSRVSDLERRKFDYLFDGVADVPGFITDEVIKLLKR